MYLVSVYFDDATNKRIQGYIDQIAKRTGNTFMLDGKVPPHLTVAAFETNNPKQVLIRLEDVMKPMKKGEIQWASVGSFLPHVVYLAPVLNQYLHQMNEAICEELIQCEGVQVSRYYQPFQWMPHTTVGKKMTTEELQVAFGVLQESFGMFGGQVVKIGVAKTNPYQDLISWKLL